MTDSIDDYLENWRPLLNPKSDHFFVQQRTGRCLNQADVYHMIVSTCFRRTGRRTNPHLLRDMIVTHVRETDASERELESLALYMGHSIQMQRSSYDRRTLDQKVAPAVNMIQSILNANSKKNGV